MVQKTQSQAKSSENQPVSWQKDSYKLVPIKPDIQIDGIPASFLYAFQEGKLEMKLKNHVWDSLSEEERQEIDREKKNIAKFRRSNLEKVLEGQIDYQRRPKTPATQRLDNTVFQLELELTRKVLDNMSRLNKNVLEREFMLLEKNAQKITATVKEDTYDSQMISSFCEKLKAVTEQAILDRKQNNVCYLNQAS